MFKSLYDTIPRKVYFINVSKEQNNIFSWKSEFSTKHHIFDIKYTENANIKRKDLFFHINKGDIKIIYLKSSKNNLIFILGADVDIQFQILEALLEYLIEQFFKKFGTVLVDFGTGSNKIFQDYSAIIEETLKSFQKLNLVTFTNIFCPVCKMNHLIAIKKSLSETAKGGNIPLVYYHDGITLLLYIDNNFVVRGVEIVSISG